MRPGGNAAPGASLSDHELDPGYAERSVVRAPAGTRRERPGVRERTGGPDLAGLQRWRFWLAGDDASEMLQRECRAVECIAAAAPVDDLAVAVERHLEAREDGGKPVAGAPIEERRGADDERTVQAERGRTVGRLE